MKKRAWFAMLLSVAVVASFGVSGARQTGSDSKDCGDGGGGHTLAWSPTKIWPPNHKYETVTITYSDDDPDHELTLTITGVSHDEVLTDGTELNGTGSTPVVTDGEITDDGGTGTGSVSGTVRVRAERSGQKDPVTGVHDGRSYTITYEATSENEDGDEDNDCSGSVTVSVPHDCRNGACKDLRPKGK